MGLLRLVASIQHQPIASARATLSERSRRAMAKLKTPQQKTRPKLLPLALAPVASLLLALALSSCENVISTTQSMLVRAIDASSQAPAVNLIVGSSLLAANLGEGTVSSYSLAQASSDAIVNVIETSSASSTTPVTLAAANATLVNGHQYSVFFTDNGAASPTYSVVVLQDQSTAAPSGHSDFRFLNQAIKTGAVDIYMVPSTSTLADSTALVSDLAVGGANTYVSFPSQTVNLVITPHGLLTSAYTSSALTLTGGEVRTVLILDNQLTSSPAVEAFIADDVN